MDIKTLEDLISSKLGVMLYFSGERCNVCHALRPKVKELFDNNFPLIEQIFLDAHENLEISVHFQVFSIPTLIVFLDGKEFVREGRNMSIGGLQEKLGRVYEILAD
ncbi:MAG: thioredoxin family protein [Campylobacterales bacterium]|nr:thioredoxin family protein [Campylobacterales bacterium]